MTLKSWRSLTGVAVVVIVVGAFIGYRLAVDEPEPGSDVSGLSAARVAQILEEGTTTLGEREQPYQVMVVEVLGGPYAGSRVTVDYGLRQIVDDPAPLRPGDQVLVSVSAGPDGSAQVYFAEYVRNGALLGLLLVFVLLIIIVSRGKGVRALIGMAISLVVIAGYILPSILRGQDPVLTSVLGSFVLLTLTYYLIHGWTLKAHAAVAATLFALILTAVLALASVEAARLTGLGSEQAMFLTQFSGVRLSMRGLLLASILIGALGVLDDLTINQVSAVFELRRADPGLVGRGLFRRAMVIGQDHIAATVNTLLLAYVGASLPLLLLFGMFGEPLGIALNRAMIAEEVVRTLVGSIGLILAVPIATGLATWVSGRRAILPAWLGPEMADHDAH